MPLPWPLDSASPSVRVCRRAKGNLRGLVSLVGFPQRQVFPLEVKASKSVAGKSLSVFAGKFAPQLAIRLSGLNLKKDGHLLNVPLCLVDWLPKFISLALHS